VLDPAQPQFATGEYGHKFLAGNTVAYWRQVNGPKPFTEVQRFIRLKRSDHGGYLAVLFPYSAGEQVPTFTAWGAGAGVQATIGDERQTVICAAAPGTFAHDGTALTGQRALVRQGPRTTRLALLAGTRLEAGGVLLEAPGPVAVAVTGTELTGEANLPAPGTVRISVGGTAHEQALPAGPSAFAVTLAHAPRR